MADAANWHRFRLVHLLLQLTTAVVLALPVGQAAQAAKALLKPQAMAEPPLMLAMADKETAFREDVERGNRPISFWAKVVDQDDRPLAGATVVFRVRAWTTGPSLNVGVLPKFREHRLTSGVSGLVALTGERGDSGVVTEVLLAGYVMSQASLGRLSPTSQTRPMVPPSSVENPAIIRMWRKLAAERLVSTAKSFKPPIDGTPVYLDLVTGKWNTNPVPADLVLTLQRDPQDLGNPRLRRFNWSVDLQTTDGGIQTNTTEFPYLAPTDGYTNRLQFAYLTNETTWKREVKLDLFIHNRNGQHYGHVTLEVVGDYGPQMLVEYKALINPAGSRNLEYDWKQRIDVNRVLASKAPAANPPPAAKSPPGPFPPGKGNPPSSGIPVILQPPPGFHALTNRGQGFGPPVPPRPQ